MHRLEPDDVPSALMAGFRERSGTYDRTVLVFPRLTSSTWEGPRLRAYATELRAAVAEGDPEARVCGALLLSADLTQAMGKDGPLAAGLGLAASFVICALAFGSVRLSVEAMVAVVAGVLLMMGGLAWTSAKLNFSNFVALPITFGIAADYAINMLRRYQAEGTMDARAAIASTAGAVAMCSATTIIGFGSLLAAKNPALFSFGLFAATGEVATLLTASLALPAAITLLDRRTRSRLQPTPPSPAFATIRAANVAAAATHGPHAVAPVVSGGQRK
jgi:predicted RND superfamily exporter protein